MTRRARKGHKAVLKNLKEKEKEEQEEKRQRKKMQLGGREKETRRMKDNNGIKIK